MDRLERHAPRPVPDSVEVERWIEQALGLPLAKLDTDALFRVTALLRDGVCDPAILRATLPEVEGDGHRRWYPDESDQELLDLREWFERWSTDPRRDYRVSVAVRMTVEPVKGLKAGELMRLRALLTALGDERLRALPDLTRLVCLVLGWGPGHCRWRE